jgi:hypothetical protein
VATKQIQSQILNLAGQKVADNAVFIDVSDKPAQANIQRGGFAVPAPKLDEQKVLQAIDVLPIVPPKDLPRVFAQSIAAGTRVPTGSTIDLVLAPKSGIPFGVFENVHADLSARAVDAIDPLVNTPAVRKILLTFDNAIDVPTADRATLTQALAGINVTVNDADPQRTFERAFDSVRGALAFHE